MGRKAARVTGNGRAPNAASASGMSTSSSAPVWAHFCKGFSTLWSQPSRRPVQWDRGVDSGPQPSLGEKEPTREPPPFLPRGGLWQGLSVAIPGAPVDFRGSSPGGWQPVRSPPVPASVRLCPDVRLHGGVRGRGFSLPITLTTRGTGHHLAPGDSVAPPKLIRTPQGSQVTPASRPLSEGRPENVHISLGHSLAASEIFLGSW